MGYSIIYDGTKPEPFKWVFFMSSHGCAVGDAATIEEALVELAIGEAAVMECPWPEPAVKALRADYVAAAKSLGLPLPWEPGWRPMEPYNGPIPEWAREVE